MIKYVKTFTTCLLLITLINLGFCRTYLDAANKELRDAGYDNPTVQTVTKNVYVLNDDAINYSITYAKTLDSINYPIEDYHWYWFAGGVFLGIVLAK